MTVATPRRTLDCMRPRITRTDVAIGVAGAVALCVLTNVALQPDTVDSWVYGLSAAAGGAFVLRRRAPVLCLVIAAAAIAVYTATDQPGGPIYVAVFIAAMNLAARTKTTRDWLPWTAAAAVALIVAEVIAGQFSLHVLPVAALLVVIPKVVADATRARMLRIDALEAQVESAEQEALRQMAEERLRIAREVHDVVGHGLAAISLRAGVADHVRDRDPAEVAEALRAIREVSKQSLGELSALLGALRDGEPAERAPAPGLDALPRLVGTLRDAGLPVDLDTSMNGGPVPEVVGAAGYRIVQESLTNVARHAGAGATASVHVVRGGEALAVEVVDDGRGAGPEVRPGGGMTGMRERAHALGGSFEAGDAPGGGFRVYATLPIGRP
jgi:signal transduction histidine kinase